MSYQGRKNTFQASQELAMKEKVHEHNIVRNAELRKFRREQLLQRQNLEKILLTEVSWPIKKWSKISQLSVQRIEIG